MGIVTELLDFNKVRRFQEFCGIVATKDDDPRGIDAVMRWNNINPHAGTILKDLREPFRIEPLCIRLIGNLISF